MPFFVGNYAFSIDTKITGPTRTNLGIKFIIGGVNPDTIVSVAASSLLLADNTLPFTGRLCRLHKSLNSEFFQLRFLAGLDNNVARCIAGKFQTVPKFSLDPLRFSAKLTVMTVARCIFNRSPDPSSNNQTAIVC